MKFKIFLVFLTVLFSGCSTDYRDYANATGRQLVLDQANNFLTARECDQAIEVLTPLYNSEYADDEVKTIYASAYACKGGLDFSQLISAFTEITGSDIWSPIIKANYSTGMEDGKISALNTAADILRYTATVPGSYEAQFREVDTNIYMLFIQMNVLAAILAPLGQATQSTGHKTVTGFGAGASNADKCRTEVAFAIIVDSVSYVDVSGNFSKVKSSVETLCTDVFAGVCPTNKIYDNCTAADRVAGELILTYIDGNQWSF